MTEIQSLIARIAASILIVLGVAWFAHHKGYESGWDARDYTATKFADVQAQVVIQHDSESDQIHDNTLKWINSNLSKLQVSTNASVKQIQVIYRDHPVVGCTRPDGVQVQLDQAIESANASASGGLPAVSSSTH